MDHVADMNVLFDSHLLEDSKTMDHYQIYHGAELELHSNRVISRSGRLEMEPLVPKRKYGLRSVCCLCAP